MGKFIVLTINIRIFEQFLNQPPYSTLKSILSVSDYLVQQPL
jgi:hypothetical protein